MELAILVYVIDLLLKVVSFSKGFLWVMAGVSVIWALVAGSANADGVYENFQ